MKLNERQKEYLLRLLFDSAVLTVDGYYWDCENEKVDLRTIGALARRGLAQYHLKGIPGGITIGAFYLTEDGSKLAEELRREADVKQYHQGMGRRA